MESIKVGGVVLRPIPTMRRTYISNDGSIFRYMASEVSSAIKNGGYVTLNHSDMSVTKLRHRLVAMAWKGLPDNYKELDVNHLNNVPGSDHYLNLEWCTRAQNIAHGVDQGRYGNSKVYVREGLYGDIRVHASMNRVEANEGVSAPLISNALKIMDVYRHASGLFASMSREALEGKSSYTQDEVRIYGKPVLVCKKTGGETEFSSLYTSPIYTALNVPPSMAMNRLSELGSDISNEYFLKYRIEGKLVDIEPWKEVIRAKKYHAYVTDTLSGDEYIFDSAAEAARELGLDRSNFLDKLTRDPGYHILGRFKIGVDDTYTKSYIPRSEREKMVKTSGTLEDLSRSVRIFDVVEKTEVKYPSIREAARNCDMTPQALRQALKSDHTRVFRPKYRVTDDMGVEFPTDLSFSDIRRISKVVLRDGDSNILEGSSLRKYAVEVQGAGHANESVVRKYLESHIRNMRKLGYSVIFVVGDAEFEYHDDEGLVRV